MRILELIKIHQKFVAMFFVGRRVYRGYVANYFVRFVNAAEKVLNVLFLHVGT